MFRSPPKYNHWSLVKVIYGFVYVFLVFDIFSGKIPPVLLLSCCASELQNSNQFTKLETNGGVGWRKFQLKINQTNSSRGRSLLQTAVCLSVESEWKRCEDNSTNQVITFLFSLETRGPYGDEHNGHSRSVAHADWSCIPLSCSSQLKPEQRELVL